MMISHQLMMTKKTPLLEVDLRNVLLPPNSYQCCFVFASLAVSDNHFERNKKDTFIARIG